jgi:hypothetical protein
MFALLLLGCNNPGIVQFYLISQVFHRAFLRKVAVLLEVFELELKLLLLFRLWMILLLLVRLNCRKGFDEIRMVVVYVTHLNLDDLLNHILRFS